jgi:phosphoglycolate phosphatase-like HAD superfamily hydrolase
MELLEVTDHPPVDTVVLDLDGTLVDTVYQHALAWVAAFDSVEVVVPAFRIHRAIGMGSDLLVAEVAGDEVEERHGDAIRECHDRVFADSLDSIHPLPGAADLVADLKRRGLKVVLATSGVPAQTEQLLDLIDARELAEGSPTTDDVEHSKPAPDLVEAAIERAGGTRAAVIGDAVWDVASAKRAGHYSVALNTGGFSESELRDAGADEVYPTPRELLEALDGTPLRGTPA